MAAPAANNIVAKRALERPLLTLGCHGPGDGELRRTELAEPGLDGYLLDGVLTAAECAQLVAAAESVAPLEGGFSFWGDAADEAGRATRERFRSADTLEARQAAIAAELWARMKPFTSEPIAITPDSPRFERDLEGIWEPVGLNEQLLFARYGPGGHFAPHVDGQTELDFDTRSLFSVIIYLNSCILGGATRMLRGEQGEATERAEDGRLVARPEAVGQVVEPLCGRALVFYQAALHDGEPVGQGAAKFIIRTDIVYRRRTPICVTEADVRAYGLYRRARDEESAGRCLEAAELFRLAFKTSRTIGQLYGA
mmetsp:Transcript_21468/g.50070  ORF Transcript_21468/g.50070 Transcript_21468/m.50070 type:complete len:311 (-) Transcript_21468:230-1162(-)